MGVVFHSSLVLATMSSSLPPAKHVISNQTWVGQLRRIREFAKHENIDTMPAMSYLGRKGNTHTTIYFGVIFPC